jgi:hypothetical protein
MVCKALRGESYISATEALLIKLNLVRSDVYPFFK